MGKSSLIFLNLILLLLIGCFEKKAKRSDTVEIHVEQRYNSKTVTEISSKEASSQLVSAQSIFVKSAEVSSSIQDHNNYPRNFIGILMGILNFYWGPMWISP